MLFMIIASINFATHFLVWRRRSAMPYRNDPEARWVVFTLLASALLIAVFLWQRETYATFGEALRYASFNVISRRPAPPAPASR